MCVVLWRLRFVVYGVFLSIVVSLVVVVCVLFVVCCSVCVVYKVLLFWGYVACV